MLKIIMLLHLPKKSGRMSQDRNEHTWKILGRWCECIGRFEGDGSMTDGVVGRGGESRRWDI